MAKRKIDGDPSAARGPLTDQMVAAPPPPAGKPWAIRMDGTLPGFCLRVTGGGGKAFIVRYRIRAGRARLMATGSPPTWAVKQARARAYAIMREVDEGGDPQAEVEAERAAPDVGGLIDWFSEQHLPKLRPSTRRDYEAMLRDFIRPSLGRMKVDAVRHSDIDKLHRKITDAGTPYRANRVVAVASKLFSFAITKELCVTNPCKGIEKTPEVRRERYLSADEVTRLLAALDDIRIRRQQTR